MLRQLMLNLNGDISKGFICFASPEFMDAYTDHPSIRELYARFKETSDQYRDTNPNMTFNHRGVQFVTYTHKFGSEVDIKAGEAHIAPLGTRKTTKEYFAPANYNATVNTKALAYYLSREKKMDKGWDLEAQTNSLSILLRLKSRCNAAHVLMFSPATGLRKQGCGWCLPAVHHMEKHWQVKQ